MQLNMSGDTIESLLYRENKAVLELKISYPQVMGPLSRQSEFRFNDFYRKQARALNRKARTELFNRACEEAKIAATQEFDFTLHSFIRTFSVTRLEPRYASVLLDRYQYSGGTHGMNTRVSDTWDLSVGNKIRLSYFFRKDSPYRNVLLQEIGRQVSQQKEKEEILFFENPLRNVRQCFSETNFYLTNDSVGIYYPLYTLAPYYAGILCYRVPFRALDGCWLSGRRPNETTPFTGGFAPHFGTELL